MRVIYLHQYFNTPAMSGGTRSYEMARRLVAAGHDVQMVTSRRDSAAAGSGWSTSTCDGIDVHWLDVAYDNGMGFVARLRAFADFARRAGGYATRLGGDVVFATSTPLTIALPGVRAARKLGVPMVFEVRDLWPEMPIAMGALKSPLTIYPARRLERYAYRNAARIVALSSGMAAGVAATGYPADNITVIPNGSDVALFQVPDAVGQAFLARHPHLAGGPLVAYGGTFGRVNRLSFMVDVARHMLDLDPTVRFVAAGDGALKAQVVEQAQKSGVLERNLWIMDPLPKKDMPALMNAATIATSFVIDLEPAWKNCANKFFDALAAGRPIAINHEGWQADILRESGAGLVMSSSDPALAAQQLHERLHDADWLAQAGRASLNLARERFDRDQLAQRLMDTLGAAVDAAQ